MRAAKSRRYSKHLYRKGFANFDIVEELTCAGFKIVYHRNVGYVCTRVFGRVSFQRCHPCHYRLCQIVFRHFQAWTFSKYQGQVVEESRMSNPVSAAITHYLDGKGVKLQSVAGFRHIKPRPLRRLDNLDKEVLSTIGRVRSELPKGLNAEIDVYHHSSEETDLDLVSQGYTVLLEREPKDFDFDVFYDLFLRVSLDVSETVDVEPFTINGQCDVVQPNSSCGALPLNTIFGCPTGTKKQMQHSAIAVNEATLAWGGVPGVLPYKPVGKDEVIKKGKKVRTIMIEPQPDVMVLKHAFERKVGVEKRIPRGRAIGLSTVGGGFKVMLMRWFLIWSEEFRGGWNEFLGWISEQPFSESDKTSWESSTNETDGMAYLLALMLDVDLCSSDHALLARAIAGYMNPAIQIDDNMVYYAPWRVPSGSYLTAHGNTERHWLMANWVCDFFEDHGSAGRVGCGCRYCELICNVEGFGEKVTPLELRFLRAYFVMGDDFIGFGYHAVVFNTLMDAVFGTSTRQCVKQFFSIPSLEEPTGVEFLKKHFYLDRTHSTWNVRCFRAPGRLLAKLFHGRARKKQSTFKAAILSGIWDCGANRQLYDILRGLFFSFKVGLDENKEILQELRRYVKRNPAVADLSPVYCPEYSMVLNCDASLLRPLERAYWSKHAQLVGTPVEWYCE